MNRKQLLGILVDESVVNKLLLSSKENETKQTIDESSSGSLRSLLSLLKLGIPEWPYLLIALLCTTAACGFLATYAISIMKTVEAFDSCTNPVRMNQLYTFTSIIMGLGIGLLIFKTLQYGGLALTGARLTNRLRIKAFRCMMKQEVGWFDKTANSVGSLCNCLSTDTIDIQKLVQVRLGLLMELFSLLTIGLTLGFIFSWRLTSIVCGTLMIVFINVIFDIRRNTRLAAKNQELLSQCSDLVTQTVRNIRTVFQLNRQKASLKTFERILDEKYQAARPSVLKSGVAFALSYPMLSFMLAALCKTTTVLIDKNLIDSQRIILLFAFIPFALDTIYISTIVSAEFARSSAAAKRLNRLFKRKPLIDNSSTDGKQIENFSGSIEFQNVTFAYPTRPLVNVLNQFQLTIKSGQCVAFVGSSGCGKSTMIQLLERFYDCNQGRLLLDGHDVRSLDLAWLRSQFGLISQQPALVCDLTIAENIAYGQPACEVTREDIIRAAKRAHCHSFIENLTQSYDASVGHNGTFYLSGGQKQRIAIARALFRNPKVLLLDEATSALDRQNEQFVQESLETARKDDPSRTFIIIAHRLSTIQWCDLICVFGPDGQLLESGTHTELIRRQQAYFKLYSDYIEGRNNP